jgi:pimeloyl-ACP methyl ester carboxylesterase
MRFVLESGRRVAVNVTRPRAVWPATDDGRPADERIVVFCHPAPGAGIFDPDPAQTQARGVTLLSVDRPGYGRSDPVRTGQWATVAAAADEIAVVLEGLHVDQIGVVGWSAGGRIALALAARHQELVDRVVVMATPAPDDEVPWIDPEQRVELERMGRLDPDEAHAELRARLRSLVPNDPFSAEALWLLAAVTSDEPSLRDPGVRERLGEMLRASFAQGVTGLAGDIAGYCLQPWGFAPEDVQAKTLLLYGSRDPLAGPRHGRWWQERIRDARLEVVPGAGHLLVIPSWARALSHLAPGRSLARLRVVAGERDGQTETDIEESPAA